MIEENVAPANKISVRKPRGVIYLGNIPHGFYEDEMKGYFSQFGKVTNLRLARSKNTGNSKGFGFIEFQEPEVAKIAAETMNNYLMCKRLLKAKFIAPEEQHEFYFKGENWTAKNYPKLRNRKKVIQKNHLALSDKQIDKSVKKYLKQINDVKKKLLEVGIEYNFIPADIPEYITVEDGNFVIKKIENETKDTSESEEEPIVEVVKEKKLKGITKKPKEQKIELSSKKLLMARKNILTNDQVKLTTVDNIKKSKINGKTKNLVSLKRKVKK